MKIQLLRDLYANSISEAVDKASEYLISLYGYHDQMQSKVNFVSFYGEKVAFQVRLYDVVYNHLRYAFWIPVNRDSISTVEKILRESDHDLLVNSD